MCWSGLEGRCHRRPISETAVARLRHGDAARCGLAQERGVVERSRAGTCHDGIATQKIRGRAGVEEEQVGERPAAIDGAGHTVEAETADAKDQGLKEAPRVVVPNDHDVPTPGGRGLALREPGSLREDEVRGRVRHLRARGAQAEDLFGLDRSQRALLRAFFTKPALEVDNPSGEREEILGAAREDPPIGFRETFVERSDTRQVRFERGEAFGARRFLRRRCPRHERHDPEHQD